LGENFRVQWVEEHTLVWAAHQLEQWTHRLALDRFEEPPEPDEVLAIVRNALEHLDEADFDEGHAIPGPLGSNRSLKMLPKGELQIALGAGQGLFLGDLRQPDATEPGADHLACSNARLRTIFMDWLARSPASASA
jgi:hypothetical protein